MKQIKPILTTILLLLLLSSISHAWQPPAKNGPIAIEDVDGHPWGEGIYCEDPLKLCLNCDEIPLNINTSMIISGIKIAISYTIFADINLITQSKLESESIIQENGSNFNNTAESGRGISTK